MEFNFLQEVGYIVAAILFIFGLKMLSKEDTAARGNLVSSIGMLIAVLVTLLKVIDPYLVLIAMAIGAGIGSLFALKVKMTSIPEMVALFNGFGGLSSFFLAWSEFNNHSAISLILILTYMTVFIGGVTFSGSLIAFFKLSEILKGSNNLLNNISRWFLVFICFFVLIAISQIALSSTGIFVFSFELIEITFIAFLVASLLAGLAFVVPIGGGDMPVVISLLNSLSGVAAALAGVLLLNTALIVAGCLVGASGLVLTLIMAKSMNRWFDTAVETLIEQYPKPRGLYQPLTPPPTGDFRRDQIDLTGLDPDDYIIWLEVDEEV